MKAIDEYKKRFGKLPSIPFNVHLRDKYDTYENLCLECIKQNKTIEQLEPIRAKIIT